jgi:hypothetical protein
MTWRDLPIETRVATLTLIEWYQREMQAAVAEYRCRSSTGTILGEDVTDEQRAIKYFERMSTGLAEAVEALKEKQ